MYINGTKFHEYMKLGLPKTAYNIPFGTYG